MLELIGYAAIGLAGFLLVLELFPKKRSYAIGIYREQERSEFPEERKEMIEATANALKRRGFEVKTGPSSEYKGEKADVIFTMSKDKNILNQLKEKEKQGIFIVNPPSGSELIMDRKRTHKLLEEKGLCMPETKHKQLKEIKITDIIGKVVFKENGHRFPRIIEFIDDLVKTIEEYKKNNIEEITIQKFIPGKEISFIAVGDDIKIVGDVPTRLREDIKDCARRIGEAMNIHVYGGDFIIHDDRLHVIDIDDWPTAYKDRKDTADKIAGYIAGQVKH